MSEYGRLLGVDVGSKRVGIARTDLMRTFAGPVGTYNQPDSFRELSRQIKHEGPVIGIVIGWPLTPQGKPTHATELAAGYIKKCRADYPNIPVYKMDERYSSKEALEFMVDAGVPKKKREEKGRLDQAAAAHILQQFLEARPEI